MAAAELEAGDADTTDAGITLYPHTGHVFRTFDALLRQFQEIRLSGSRCVGRAAQLVRQFETRLKAEFLVFSDVLSELTDPLGEIGEPGWMLAEQAVSAQYGVLYGRYLDALDRILDGLAQIASFLGLQHNPPRTESSPIRAILRHNDRWANFLLSLGTVTGFMGGDLQRLLSRVQDANDQLREIRGESRRDPSAAMFRPLEALHRHLETVADVLGNENGFACSCKTPHRTFLRIKDCFELGDDRPFPTLRDQVCSLVVENPSPQTDPSWNWADLDCEIVSDDNIQPKTALAGGLPKPAKLKSALKSVGVGDPSGRRRRLSMLKPSFLGFGNYSDVSKTAPEPADGDGPRMPLVSNPPAGLCAFIAGTPSNGEAAAAHMTLSRRDSSLRIRLGRAHKDASTLWTGALSVREQFADAGRPALSTGQKLQLAHRVGSCLFYLQSTPWLRDRWDSDSIYLARRRGGDTVVEPLLARLAPELIERAAEGEAFRGSTIFSSLGRFLVELCYGASWAEIQDIFLPGADLSFACEADSAVFSNMLAWLEDPAVAACDKPSCCHLEGRSYFEAIRSCFSGGLWQDLRDGSVSDHDFHVGVFNRVLLPLQFALEDFRARQTRIFGPIIDVAREAAPRDPDGNNAFRLFDDEDVKGDVAQKTKDADAWFVKYDQVQALAAKVSPRRPDMPQTRIRVAILDTGVDVTHDQLKGPWRRRQIVYQDFVGPASDIPKDEHGHGTHVVSILLKVAANVDVYVGRISADGKGFKSDQVEKAIEWAVQDKHAHVISISFGFPNLDQSLEPIRSAILRAHAADVLVFATAGNRGRGHPVSHPVSFPASMDEVISVGSADGGGARSGFVPALGPGRRLCAIGEAIGAAWVCEGSNKNNKKSHGTVRRKAGTSYATPVAAGVAAMIMDFVWSERRPGGPGERYEHLTLRTRRGMLAVLALMVERDAADAFETLAPWRLFDEGLAAPLAGERSAVLDKIILRLRTAYTEVG